MLNDQFIYVVLLLQDNAQLVRCYHCTKRFGNVEETVRHMCATHQDKKISVLIKDKYSVLKSIHFNYMTSDIPQSAAISFDNKTQKLLIKKKKESDQSPARKLIKHSMTPEKVEIPTARKNLFTEDDATEDINNVARRQTYSQLNTWRTKVCRFHLSQKSLTTFQNPIKKQLRN